MRRLPFIVIALLSTTCGATSDGVSGVALEMAARHAPVVENPRAPLDLEARDAFDLGTLGGSDSWANAMNDSGTVVGWSEVTGDTATHPFAWSRAKGMRDLGTLGGASGWANVITSSGAVFGASYIPGDRGVHAFLWTAAAGMEDLGTLGGIGSEVMAASDTGYAIGQATDAGEVLRAFIWSRRDGMRDLGSLDPDGPALVSTRAFAVNNQGVVVGVSVAADGWDHAVVWTKQDGMIDIGTVGGRSSSAHDINDRGQVIGWSTTRESETISHAFLWTRSHGMIDLGTLHGGHTVPLGLNARGDVVGVSADAETYSCPFLWTRSDGMKALFEACNTSADLVSDSGYVIGTGPGPVIDEFQGYLWRSGRKIRLAPTEPYTRTFPIAVHERGDVAGNMTFGHGPDEPGGQRAAIWTAHPAESHARGHPTGRR